MPNRIHFRACSAFFIALAAGVVGCEDDRARVLRESRRRWALMSARSTLDVEVIGGRCGVDDRRPVRREARRKKEEEGRERRKKERRKGASYSSA